MLPERIAAGFGEISVVSEISYAEFAAIAQLVIRDLERTSTPHDAKKLREDSR